MDTIKVYIADGSELIREAVRSVLLHSSFIFVSGHSGNGEKALNEIKQQVQILENDKQNLLRELDKEKQLVDKLDEQNTGL